MPDRLKTTSENFYIFQRNTAGDDTSNGGDGVWTKLKPGHGTAFSADEITKNYSNRFGPEIGFADRMQQRYPGKKITIIKNAKEGGSSIDTTGNGTFGTASINTIFS
ncbi:MAG: hypothetical protein WBG71_12635 [Leeuwenhoekiella sp.]